MKSWLHAAGAAGNSSGLSAPYQKQRRVGKIPLSQDALSGAPVRAAVGKARRPEKLQVPFRPLVPAGGHGKGDAGIFRSQRGGDAHMTIYTGLRGIGFPLFLLLILPAINFSLIWLMPLISEALVLMIAIIMNIFSNKNNELEYDDVK